MKLLFSNLAPVKTNSHKYVDIFEKYAPSSDKIRIATGYVSSEAIVDLHALIKANHGPSLELIIGMHYFDGLTKSQYEEASKLNKYLKSENLGSILAVTVFPYHGKITSFYSSDSPSVATVGSSNMTSMIPNYRQYEADVLIEEAGLLSEVDDFLNKLKKSGCDQFESLEFPIIEPKNNLLEDQYGVTKTKKTDLMNLSNVLSEITFDIPLKGDEAPMSNLNTYFGKGRENQRGFILPRHWYETELIVPKHVTVNPNYPKADSHGDSGIFTVITDDGWTFKCKVSGDYSKNLRSEGDLRILGKWIKGRLEKSNALSLGEKVTNETFNKYGRNTITLTKLKQPNDTWYLDFGIK